MNFEHWITFVVAYTIISLIPGPSVLMVISQALSHGLRAAFLCIIGDLLGGVVIIAAALFGLGAVLAASATAFMAVKWLGVGYMAYLGLHQILSANKPPSIPKPGTSVKAGFLVGVLNPKAIIFYMAFLSQFITAGSNPALQFAILVPTSFVVVGVVLAGYALAANRAARLLRSKSARRNMGYASGGTLISGSVMMALTR